MVLQKNSNQKLWYLLIAYAFCAFLMPLSTGIAAILCILTIVAVLVLNDSDLLCFLAFSICYAGGTGLTALFLTIYDIVLALIVVKYLILSIKRKDKKYIKFICAILCLTLVLTLYGLIRTKFRIYKLGGSRTACGGLFARLCTHCHSFDTVRLCEMLCSKRLMNLCHNIFPYA